MKIDVAVVTRLVSQAYATRFQILPLSVTENEVTIATAEPFITEWENELRTVLGRQIRHVIANPVDIKRYLKEFSGHQPRG